MTEKVKDFLKKTLPTYSINIDGNPVFQTDDLSELTERVKEFVTAESIKGCGFISITNSYNFYDNLDDDE